MKSKPFVKEIRVILICVNLLCLLTSGAIGQPSTGRTEISGTITDSSGSLLPGVSVTVKKSPSIGTTSDLNGKYILDVPSGATLAFSMVGFEGQEVSTAGKKVINIRLMPAARNDMDDVVVVAFGKQKKANVVGAVTTINPEELKVPSSNLTTALAGRLAGVIAYQRSGEPGSDNANFFIRGITTFGYKNDPLILIDNIEVTSTELGQLQPDDIASFSIMKDATATALYGARGANGVILVITKRGKEGKAKVSLRAENSISQPTKVIELADPVTYMKLHNEAVLTRADFNNPNLDLPYTQEKINNTVPGADPLLYPAIDWRKELFRDHAINNRLNFSVSGGGQTATYYLSGTLNQDNGMLKVPKRSNFNNNIDLKNYSLRSNVKINLTKSTEASVLLSGNFTEYIGPRDGGAAMYNKLVTSNPVLFPAFFEPTENTRFAEHILFGNYSDGGDVLYQNPYADMVSGYREYSQSKINALFELKQDLSVITQGLAVRALMNTSRLSRFDVSRFYRPFYYMAGTLNKETGEYNLAQLNEKTGSESLEYDEGPKQINNSTYIEAALSYNRTFQEKHGLSGMLVLLMNNRVIANAGSLQTSLPYRNIGVSGRFTYARNQKYFAEFAFGYNGSERFYKTERFGFFPSVGLAWAVSNEKFWEPLQDVVTQFKLRATYGLIGNDAIGSATDRFFYLSEVSVNAPSRSATFGQDFGTTLNGVQVFRYDNREITWEQAAKANLGIEMNLFNSIQLIADLFQETRTNILMGRTNIPNTSGLSSTPQSNLGEAEGKGIDLSLNYNKTFGNQIWLQATGNFTYAESKMTRYEEPDYEEEYLTRVGSSIYQPFGYIAERLFVDEADVANSPVQNFGEYRAGDIKYRDVNGDGEITSRDRVPIGFPTLPRITYGFGFSAGYKQLDFSAFFQGLAQESFFVNQEATAPFVDAGAGTGYIREQALLKEYAESYWSEENRNIYAKWPRLNDELSGNNLQASTWNQRDGSFLRLKNLEMGYSLPSRIAKKWRITQARIYVNGSNLFLLSKFKMWDVEMGGSGLGYPVQKVYNFGVQLSF